MNRRNLGDILLEAGRITPADVERALEYQRVHGGYFGQALVALGFVRTEEVEWALASQFDLPLVFPDADSVDREVAALVPAEWSLENLAVPIVRAGDTLTVVVENPLDTGTIEELHQRTGLEIELALAPSARIRGLVRALYGEAVGERAAKSAGPVPLSEFLRMALDAGAEQVGISTRGNAALVWYRAGGNGSGRGGERPPAGRRPGAAFGYTRVRRRLTPEWPADLATLIEPMPTGRGLEGRRGASRWSAVLSLDRERVRLDARALVGIGGADYLFRPIGPVHSGNGAESGVELPPAVAGELRVLGRGGARIAFEPDDPAHAGSILPRLPALVWGDGIRAAHVAARAGAAAEESGAVAGTSRGVLSKFRGLFGGGRTPASPAGPDAVGAGYAAEAPEPVPPRSGAAVPYTLIAESPADPLFEALADYRFDILTVDLLDGFPLHRVFDAAPVILARLHGDGRDERYELYHELGIDWVLEARTREQGDPEWELRAVRD